MPTTMHFVPEWRSNAGVSIEWRPRSQRLGISGFYDTGFGGVEGESLTLREFFDRLNITEAHCRKAFGKKKVKR